MEGSRFRSLIFKFGSHLKGGGSWYIVPNLELAEPVDLLQNVDVFWGFAR